MQQGPCCVPLRWALSLIVLLRWALLRRPDSLRDGTTLDACAAFCQCHHPPASPAMLPFPLSLPEAFWRKVLIVSTVVRRCLVPLAWPVCRAAAHAMPSSRNQYLDRLIKCRFITCGRECGCHNVLPARDMVYVFDDAFGEGACYSCVNGPESDSDEDDSFKGPGSDNDGFKGGGKDNDKPTPSKCGSGNNRAKVPKTQKSIKKRRTSRSSSTK